MKKKALLSMSKLGDKIGTKSSTISNWENERKQPSAKMIISLSEFFNVSTDWLLKGEEASPYFYKINGNLLTVEEEKRLILISLTTIDCIMILNYLWQNKYCFC
ncbi:helix-turn-helix domain-containing protein [Bacillus sp. N9]